MPKRHIGLASVAGRSVVGEPVVGSRVKCKGARWLNVETATTYEHLVVVPTPEWWGNERDDLSRLESEEGVVVRIAMNGPSDRGLDVTPGVVGVACGPISDVVGGSAVALGAPRGG